MRMTTEKDIRKIVEKGLADFFPFMEKDKVEEIAISIRKNSTVLHHTANIFSEVKEDGSYGAILMGYVLGYCNGKASND